MAETPWVIAGIAVVGVPVISYIVEALRRPPTPPERLSWSNDIPIRYVSVHGVRLRYIVLGEGRPLVLLHTLRTQLDMFQLVVRDLARRHRVYAVDFPGHGFSDIPRTEYVPQLFVDAAAGFLDALAIYNATVVGESIGGSVALLLAARADSHVRDVVAVNPYDYDKGRGIRRSSFVSNVLFAPVGVPIVGETVLRLRSYPLVRRVFEGGLRRQKSLPESLSREMYLVGNRRGHYRAFDSLLRHAKGWEEARSEYHRITRPVLLVYGEHDWSRVAEREADQRAIPGAAMQQIAGAGHFISLDAPHELVDSILAFADRP